LEDNVNVQAQMMEKRTFRIAVIAAAAVAVLGLAAYLFGNGLRADSPPSVAPAVALADSRANFYADLNSSAAASSASLAAPSALGASSLDARGARTVASAARAASLAALAKSRSDFYADQNAAAEAARWAAVAARDREWAIFYMAVNATNAKASGTQ
jgi:hypothetical protein